MRRASAALLAGAAAQVLPAAAVAQAATAWLAAAQPPSLLLLASGHRGLWSGRGAAQLDQQQLNQQMDQQQQHAHQQQQRRGYAKKAGAKGAAAAAAAAPPPPKAAAPTAPAGESFDPPQFRLKRVPQAWQGDPMESLTEPQKALLQQLKPGPQLRSLRQLGWPLGPKQTLALWHEQLGAAANTNVYVLPFVLDSMFQSAAALASVVKDYVASGKGMPAVEQAMLVAIANTPPAELPCEGIRVQLKGRMSGKGGKAAKKVWAWGRTSASSLADPVDYAHEAVVTRAGYIGIKVWIKYKRSHMADQVQASSRAAVSVADVLAMPRVTALPSRSSSAWWAAPAVLQPSSHRSWECYRPGYDPLTGAWADGRDSSSSGGKQLAPATQQTGDQAGAPEAAGS